MPLAADCTSALLRAVLGVHACKQQGMYKKPTHVSSAMFAAPEDNTDAPVTTAASECHHTRQ
jgi:hypothetical protein